MKKTNISWTHHTFNGWIGCTRVSPGCDDCFAAMQVEKLGLAKWGQDETRIKTGEATWNAPLQWNRACPLHVVGRFLRCESRACLA